MLRNSMKFVLSVLLTVFVSGVSFAGSSSSTSNNQSFAPAKNSTLTWGVSDYLLAGCSDPDSFTSSCHGTFGDEGAIVVNMARKFNDRGGYFCPTQIQFGNANKEKKIWVNLNNPADGAAGCKWICVDGKKGTDCAEDDDGSVVDEVSMTNLKKGTLRTSGGDGQRVSGTVDVFDKSEHASNSDDRSAWIHVLAILKYQEHGVLVGHLWVYGKRNWEGAWYSSHECQSWVYKVHGETNNGREVLLCADGYRVVDGQCVLISKNPVPKPMCAGWTEQQYKAHETDLEYFNDENLDCRKFRCSDRSKAFPSENNRVCEPCSTGVRGGAAPDTGVCKKCDLGQFFNESSGICETAIGLSKQDLQYGKGKSNTGNPKDQCWTKTDPDAYKCCVTGNATACANAKKNGTNTTSGTIHDFSSTVSSALSVSKISLTDEMRPKTFNESYIK